MSEFVKMRKDGVIIEVSPLTVEDHKRLKWEVVEEKPAKAEKTAPEGQAPEAETAADAKAAEKKVKAEAKKAAKKAKAETPAGE